MISLEELLKGRAKFSDLPKEVQNNLLTLLERMAPIRAARNKPMKVNDGYRRPEDTPKNGSKTSWHLKGAAVDIDDDAAGTLWFWLMADPQMALLKKTGLWLEHGCYTHHSGGSWVHFQIFPPKSNSRIFIPSTAPNPAPKFWDGKYDPKYN